MTADKQKVVKVVEKGKVTVTEAPIPNPKEDEILVKNVAAAQNPIDWQCVHWEGFIYPGRILGCDYAGVVVHVGEKVKRFKKGDRVAGFVHGGFGPTAEHSGAFAEYVVGLEDLALKVPENVQFEDAVTLGVALITVAQALYLSLQLPWPEEPVKDAQPLLIYGGSTSMGALAIQFAKLSGMRVISTCSKKNMEFVKALGADVVFDRKEENLVQLIRDASNNKLTKAFDPVAREDSPQITTNSISEEGGIVHSLHILNKENYRSDVELPFLIVHTATGRDFELAGMQFSVIPEHRALGARIFCLAEKFLAAGTIKTHPVKILPNGLASVSEGLDLGKAWALSAEKLVYQVANTPK